MAFTQRFRDQHVELLKVASEMAKYLEGGSLVDNADTVRNLLSKLAAKLIVHLGGEDKFLYPKLMKHDDQGVRELAKKFADEMGGITGVFMTYKSKWSSGDIIKKNPQDFIKETKGLFDALTNRIERENKELYPVVDKVI